MIDAILARSRLSHVMTMATDPAALLALIREGIETMPFNRLLGIRIVGMSATEGRAVLPSRADLANHVGTVHTAAQAALAEAAAGATVSAAFVDLLGDAVPLAQGMEISHLRAVTGELVAVATLDAAVGARVREALARDGHARFAVAVRVGDIAGESSLEASMRWVIRSRAGGSRPGPAPA